MDKKVWVVGGGLFLIALFLATLGNFYTGYSILEQDKISLQYYPYPFVKNNVPNNVLVVIPYDYTYDEFNAANEIATSLKGKNLAAPLVVTDKEIPSGEHNLILIGNPCNNVLISRALATVDCSSDLESGQGILKLINNDRTSTLVVSGHDRNDIHKALIVLTNYNFYPLMGESILVEGEVGNLVLNYK